MIGFPSNLNSIRIPMIPKGCVKAEFDSTYPVHLNGIINAEEFQQSIQTINRAASAKKAAIILLFLLLILGTIGGMICFVVGGIMATNSSRNRFSVLMAFGFLFTVFGSLVFSIGMFMIHSKRTKRMREAIIQESAKYSSRSPIPCSWRLNIANTWNRGFGYQRNGHSTYDLVIDIGNYAGPHSGGAVYYSNQPPAYPARAPEGQETFTPPPYSAQSRMQTCSRCGTARQDLTTKMCSTCGAMFNNY